MKRLYRSRTNKRIAGICGGIGEMLDVDPTVIRLLVIVVALTTGVIPMIIGYIIAMFVIPSDYERPMRMSDPVPGAAGDPTVGGGQ
jgi:phage shock protein PspC (stress-responsive transcriptional regulator)